MEGDDDDEHHHDHVNRRNDDEFKSEHLDSMCSTGVVGSIEREGGKGNTRSRWCYHCCCCSSCYYC